MLKFPEVPSDLSALDDDALDALRQGLARTLRIVTSGDYDPEPGDVEKIGLATEAHDAVKALQAERKTESEKAAATLAAAAASLVEDEATAGPDDDEEDDEDEGEVEEVEAEVATSEATVEDEDEVEEVVDLAASTSSSTAGSITTLTRKAAPARGVGAKTRPLSGAKQGQVVAFDNVPGKRAGEAFDGWRDVAEALQTRASTVKGKDLVPVAAVKADYPKERTLLDTPGSNAWNLSRFEPDEIQAALCAPCTPYYNLSCANTDRRPVFNSLPQFAAPRGCVSIYPSPTLADITTGHGLWTHLDDADDDAEKEECQTISCATPTEYFFYGVYRCLTIKNMLQMTFPELVEAYLNRLAAASARQAEVQLLDLMASAVNHIEAASMITGASQTLTVGLLKYLAGYQERERWDTPEMEMWAPRWLQSALRADIYLQRVTAGGGRKRVPSVAEVNSIFTDIGVTPHWFIDTPTWGITAPVQGTGATTLAQWPEWVRVLVAPRGKFALIDRGELRIGVTGNNIYRDNTSNSRNEFTMFFETFEGIVDTNSCPADSITFPLCFNGVQVADVDADCFATDSNASS